MKTEIIVIGTIHREHFEAKHYTAQVVKDIILALKPDAICVELYSKHFDPDGTPKTEVLEGFKDCPEVQAVNEAAIELGVRQIPFDREGRDELLAETNYFEREQKSSQEFQEWMERLKEDAPESDDYRLGQMLVAAMESQQNMDRRATPDIINSDAFDAVIRIKHHLVLHILPEVMGRYPEMEETADSWRLCAQMWEERNGIMAENLMRIACEFVEGRLAVSTGAEHRYILRDLLKDNPGIVLREYWEVLPGK